MSTFRVDPVAISEAAEAGSVREAGVPKVSVVVPLFNGAQTIKAALDSIRATGWQNAEVVVVDDGSSDAGVEMVRDYGRTCPEMKIVLLRHPDNGNHGPAASRNLGIARCQGEFVCFLDADDLFLPSRFVCAIEALVRDRKLDAVHGVYRYGLPGDMESCRDVTLDHLHASRFDVIEPSEHPLVSLLNGKSGTHTSTVTMRRESALALGGFPDLKYVDDLAFWIRLFACGRVQRTGTEPVSTYVIHPDSWCSRGQRSDEFLLGPAIACLDALEWPGANLIPANLRHLIVQTLISRLLSRYHRVVLRGRSSQRLLLSLMRRCVKVAPAAMLNLHFIVVMGRLVLNAHPKISEPADVGIG
jgi:hypothetical protein